MKYEITPEDRDTPLTVADFKEFLNQLAEAFAAAPPLDLHLTQADASADIGIVLAGAR